MITNEELNKQYGHKNIQQLDEDLRTMMEQRDKLLIRVKEIEYKLSQLRKKEDVKIDMLDKKTFVNYYSLYTKFNPDPTAEPKTKSETPSETTKATTETKVTNFINEFNSNIINQDKIEKYNKVLLFIYKFLETYEINEPKQNEMEETKEETKEETNQQEYKPEEAEDTKYRKFKEFIEKSRENINYKILKNLKQSNRLEFSYFLLNNI